MKEKEFFFFHYLNQKINEYKKRVNILKNSDVLNKSILNISKYFKQYLGNYDKRIEISIKNLLTINRVKLENLKKRMENNDIVATLNRGYALIYKNNTLLQNKKDIYVDDEIDIQLSNFRLKAKVIEIKGDQYGK